MRIKYLIIAGLILAIITMGAVSASDDVSQDILSEDSLSDDVLTVSDEEDQLGECDSDAVSSSDFADEIGTDERSNVSYEISIPKQVRAGEIDEHDYVRVDDGTLPFIYYEFDTYDATGNFSILIDDSEVFTDPIKGYWDTDDCYFYLNDLKIPYGNHTVKVTYPGDENYLPFSVVGTYEYYYMKYTPKTVFIGDWNSQQLEVFFALDATGKLNVSIDDEFIDSYSVYGERADEYEGILTELLYVDLSDEDLALGNHSYELKYYGGNYPDKTLKGNLTVDYQFEVNFPRIDEDDCICYFGDEVEAEISLVEDSGKLTLNLNGVDHRIMIDNYFMTYVLQDLVYGKNDLIFTYEHSEYPTKKLNFTLYQISKINYPYDDVIYGSDEGNISVLLPGDASGNLSVYHNVGEDEEYMQVLIKSVPVVNGEASISMSYMDLGNYYVTIAYDGEDYPVENVSTGISVIPNVAYPKGVWKNSAQEYNVTVTAPESAVGNMSVEIYTVPENEYDYDFVPQLIRTLYNGTAKPELTLKLPDLNLGSYNLKVVYNDDDKYIFQDIDLYFTVGSKNPVWQMKVDIPEVLYIGEDENELYYKPSNLPSNADGKLILYVDGDEESHEWVDEYPDFEWYYWDLSTGNHTWRLEYVRDSYYCDSFANGTFEIVESDPDYDPEYDDPEYDEVEVHVYTEASLDDRKDYFAMINCPDDAYGSVYVYINGSMEYMKLLEDCRYRNGGYVIGPNDVDYDWKAGFYEIEVEYIDGNYDDANVTSLVEITSKSSSGPVTPSGNGQTDSTTPSSSGAGSSAGTASTQTVVSAPASQSQNAIKLTLSNVKVKKSAKKLVLTATLKINGKAAKGKTVKFKFNGKTYKAKTNKKGVAKVTVKKAVLKKLKVGKKVTYQASYGSKTVKKSVKVKK